MRARIFSGIPSLCSARHQVASVTTTGGSGPSRCPPGEGDKSARWRTSALPWWGVATQPALHGSPRPMRSLKGDQAKSKAQRRGCPGPASTTGRVGAKKHFQGLSCWAVAACPPAQRKPAAWVVRSSAVGLGPCFGLQPGPLLPAPGRGYPRSPTWLTADLLVSELLWR